MGRRRVEACESWRPPPSVALLRAGPRLPAFASLSVREGGGGEVVNAVAVGEVEAKEERRLPPAAQLVRHPLALLALVPDSAALFAAGAAAGAMAKTVTAPLDRVKLLMQVRDARIVLSGSWLRLPAMLLFGRLIRLHVVFISVDA
jgi:solute carrier family 25 (mitochondrial phosphate transporter), member 23/24/25/41